MCDQRLQELRDCSKDAETSGLKVELVDESNLLHWKGHIKGPVGTPYEGGLFNIYIVLPPDYPFVPPKVPSTSAPQLALDRLLAHSASRWPARRHARRPALGRLARA